MDGNSASNGWGRTFEVYPAFLRPVERSGFAAFFSAGFLPAIGNSISFWPAVALRGFLPFAGGSLARLFLSASIRSMGAFHRRNTIPSGLLLCSVFVLIGNGRRQRAGNHQVVESPAPSRTGRPSDGGCASPD